MSVAARTRDRTWEDSVRMTFVADDPLAALHEAFDRSRLAMCASDPALPDMPIVYANAAFLDLTGYDADEIVGRNCRFLQGPETDRASVDEMKAAIAERGHCIVELLNYRKNGEAFWNALHIGPIHDQEGRLRYLFGSQWDISELNGEQMPDTRVANLLAVIGSIVEQSLACAADRSDPAGHARERIAALGKAQDASREKQAPQAFADLGRLADTIFEPLSSAGLPVERNGDAVRLKTAAVVPLALILHELAAYPAERTAMRRLDWSLERGVLQITWVGPCAQDGSTPSRIIAAVAESFGAEMTMEKGWLTLRFPAETVLAA